MPPVLSKLASETEYRNVNITKTLNFKVPVPLISRWKRKFDDKDKSSYVEHEIPCNPADVSDKRTYTTRIYKFSGESSKAEEWIIFQQEINELFEKLAVKKNFA